MAMRVDRKRKGKVEACARVHEDEERTIGPVVPREHGGGTVEE